MHGTELVATIAAGLGAALVLGAVARRVGLSPILGYLLAGVAVGPHTPGFVADVAVASQLAEVGIVLLMFGVGLHFSLRDLTAVAGVAVPGAIVQSAVATGLGMLAARAFGWSAGAGLVFGLALSVASTVVLVRGLSDRGSLDSDDARVAVGWLLVEDLFTVLVLVLLPALAGPLGGTAPEGPTRSLLASVALALGKIALLGGIVLTVGSRVVPWLLVHVARLESRELFTLCVLAVALGIAYGAAAVFGVSMALGAFLAGMVVAQSDLSHRAAAEALPLRDAFAVLFFVSVGMLFDPAFLLARPWVVLATLGIVLVAKPLTALAIVLLLRRPAKTGLVAAAGLAQIGEFSFILATVGTSLGLLTAEGSHAVLAGALLSIAVNPFLFRAVDLVEPALRRFAHARGGNAVAHAATSSERHGHAILCGHGRVGRVLVELLRARGFDFVVVEHRRSEVEAARRAGLEVFEGDAADPTLLDLAGVKGARILVLALSDPVATRLVATHAARENPDLPVVARVEGDRERAELADLPLVEPVVAPLESAFAMAGRLLAAFGSGPLEREAAILDLRRAHGVGPPDAGARFVEIPVPAAGAASGRRIADLGLPAGALIVLVRRKDRYVVPTGSLALEGGDSLLALATSEGLAGLQAAVLDAPVPRVPLPPPTVG